MVAKAELLDVLRARAGCEYLSDLRYLKPWQRLQLARALEDIPAKAATLAEWNDALVYLSRCPPQETAVAARAWLIDVLSRPR